MKQRGLSQRDGRNILSRVLALLFLLVAAVPVYAQEITLRGTVITSDEQPVPEAEIRIKGQEAVAATTTPSGQFTLKVSKRDVIRISKIGYVDTEVPVSLYIRGNMAEFTVTLFNMIEHFHSQQEVLLLNGTQKKERVTGAYSQMNFSDVAENPIVNNMHKMTGHLSGLMIFQSNGEPGVEASRALIRGQRSMRSNDPVILVDGFERDMSLLDPDEIETITIMKDAAATAQYGLRGGNGIISVTTKRGQVGKIKVTLSASGGFKQNVTTPKLMNSYNYATLYNEAQYNDYDNGERTAEQLAAFQPKYTAAVLEKYRQAASGNYESEMDKYLYPDINWYDDYVKKNTWQQRYNITANGGTAYAKYFVAVGYLKNDGVFNTDKDANTYKTNADMNMITLRSNLDIQATRKMLVSVNFSARQEQRTYPGSASDFSSRVFQSLYRTTPNAHPVHNPDGSLAGTNDYKTNPYGLLNNQGYSLGYIRNLDADITLKHKLDFITQGLNVSGTFAFDTYFQQTTSRNKTFAVYQLEKTANADGTFEPVYAEDGSLTYSTNIGTASSMGTSGSYPGAVRTLAWKINFDYQRDFGKHSVAGIMEYNQRQIHQESNTNLPRQYLNLNTRLSYAYDNRYLFDFTAGYEGSEQFPKGDRFGFFPAVSAGWVLSNENFLSGSRFLSFLKIRASYGLTGLDDLGSGSYFLHLYRFKSNGTTQYGKSLPASTSVKYTVWSESALAQKVVTWAKIEKANIGIDAAFLDNKLDLSVDIFQEKSKDIMIEPPFTYLLGTKIAFAPLGKMENKGLDMSLSYNDHIGSVKYRLFGVYTTYSDKVIENGELTPLYAYQTRKGRPQNQAWGLQTLGYFTQADLDNPNTPSQTELDNVRPGDLRYKDQNGDGIIDSNDQVFLGRQSNNNQASFQLELGYKGFDFSVQMVGQWGGSMSLNNESAYEFYQNGGVLEHHLNRYNPRDPDSYVDHGMKFYKGDYPRLSLTKTTNNRQSSDFWRVSTDLLRLKTIELGYTFNADQLKKLRLENLRIYVSGYNLASWSATDLVDVEANSGSGIVYPIQRIWSFGAKISF